MSDRVKPAATIGELATPYDYVDQHASIDHAKSVLREMRESDHPMQLLGTRIEEAFEAYERAEFGSSDMDSANETLMLLLGIWLTGDHVIGGGS